MSKTETLYFTLDVLFCYHAFSGIRFLFINIKNDAFPRIFVKCTESVYK